MVAVVGLLDGMGGETNEQEADKKEEEKDDEEDEGEGDEVFEISSDSIFNGSSLSYSHIILGILLIKLISSVSFDPVATLSNTVF